MSTRKGIVKVLVGLEEAVGVREPTRKKPASGTKEKLPTTSNDKRPSVVSKYPIHPFPNPFIE
jgi:hypothetical protein